MKLDADGSTVEAEEKTADCQHLEMLCKETNHIRNEYMQQKI